MIQKINNVLNSMDRLAAQITVSLSHTKSKEIEFFAQTYRCKIEALKRDWLEIHEVVSTVMILLNIAGSNVMFEAFYTETMKKYSCIALCIDGADRSSVVGMVEDIDKIVGDAVEAIIANDKRVNP